MVLECQLGKKMLIETNCPGVLMAILLRVTGRYKKDCENKARLEYNRLSKEKDVSFVRRSRD